MNRLSAVVPSFLLLIAVLIIPVLSYAQAQTDAVLDAAAVDMPADAKLQDAQAIAPPVIPDANTAAAITEDAVLPAPNSPITPSPAPVGQNIPAEAVPIGVPLETANDGTTIEPPSGDGSPSLEDIVLDMENMDDTLTPIDMQLAPVTIEKTPEELEEEIRQEAFDAAITGLFPLRPDQIRQVLHQYDQTEEAVKVPIKGMPKPSNSVKTVSLDPGVDPLTINTSYGFVTTLNMLDITGAPWPIEWISWAGNFEVSNPESGGYSIRIMPMDKYAYGNLVVRFLTLKTPVTFTLGVSYDVVDYRVDLRIPEYGPFAQASIIENDGLQLAAGDSKVMSLLDGDMPSDGEKLTVAGVDARTTAYKAGEQVYVRTPLTLLSPSWQSSASSADGMNVYVLNDTSVLLLSDRGKFFRAQLNEGEDLFDE